MLWKSQLQTGIALSSTEGDHAGSLRALRGAVRMMELLEEMKQLNFPVQSATPTVHCKMFEDNSGALVIASVHKFRPRNASRLAGKAPASTSLTMPTVLECFPVVGETCMGEPDG
jgi:hypothetical protein